MGRLPRASGPGRRAVLGGLLALAAAPRAARAVADTAPEGIAPCERAAMARAAAGFMADQDVPGLSVAIAKDGRLVYRAAFGLADREAREPLTPAHRFRIASVSKPLTAIAVFGLVEQGRLRLGDRVFGPGGVLAAAYAGPRERGHLDAVTVDHLLTHTVGAWSNGGGDPMFFDPRWSHADLIVRTLAQRPVERPPGSAYAYSNFGYCLLGRVIEAVTGEPYDAYVRRAVLAPSGAGAMRIAGSTRSERAAGEVVYHRDPHRRGNDPYGMNVTRMDSHGGWLATAEELVRVGVRLSADRPVPAALLRPETVAAMTTPSAVNARYARGWNVSEPAGREGGTWWHGGSLPGTRTILVRTRSGFTWSGLCNARGGSDGRQALDRLLWTMVRAVSAWPAGDLFERG